MQDILTSFLALPAPWPAVVLAAAFGVTGYCAGHMLRRRVKFRYLAPLLAVLGILLSMPVKVNIARDNVAAGTIAEMKKIHLYDVLFRAHPEAEADFAASLQEAMQKLPPAEVTYFVQVTTAAMVEHYYRLHMMTASDAAIYDLIRNRAGMIARFSDRPQLCVGYYLGEPQYEAADLTQAFLEDQSNVKAAIIESSAAMPAELPPPTALKPAVEAFVSAYKADGNTAADWDRLGMIRDLPPEEGCRLASAYSKTLAGMPMRDSVEAFKAIMILMMLQDGRPPAE